MSLTIHGRTRDGEYLCFETERGQETGITSDELARLRMRSANSMTGLVTFEGNTLDESDVCALIKADSEDQPIWPAESCVHCGEPAFGESEPGWPLCRGHLAGFAMREEESAS